MYPLVFVFNLSSCGILFVFLSFFFILGFTFYRLTKNMKLGVQTGGEDPEEVGGIERI